MPETSSKKTIKYLKQLILWDFRKIKHKVQVIHATKIKKIMTLNEQRLVSKDLFEGTFELKNFK